MTNEIKPFCIVEHDSTAFPLNISAKDTVIDLKDAIKKKANTLLDHIRAGDHSLECLPSIRTKEGQSWRLPTGTDIEKLIYDHTVTLETETVLHSFIVDKTHALAKRFENEEDKVLFEDHLGSHDRKVSPELSEWMKAEIFGYALSPEKSEERLSGGWKSSGKDKALVVDDAELLTETIETIQKTAVLRHVQSLRRLRQPTPRAAVLVMVQHQSQGNIHQTFGVRNGVARVAARRGVLTRIV
ncbi:hypothetical protein BGX26_011002 [Mortierella sp. AD094]|nr:hypothetical protein BGX26_011002 [Mortierella sp. AD094]